MRRATSTMSQIAIGQRTSVRKTSAASVSARAITNACRRWYQTLRCIDKQQRGRTTGTTFRANTLRAMQQHAACSRQRRMYRRLRVSQPGTGAHGSSAIGATRATSQSSGNLAGTEGKARVHRRAVSLALVVRRRHERRLGHFGLVRLPAHHHAQLGTDLRLAHLAVASVFGTGAGASASPA